MIEIVKPSNKKPQEKKPEEEKTKEIVEIKISLEGIDNMKDVVRIEKLFYDEYAKEVYFTVITK